MPPQGIRLARIRPGKTELLLVALIALTAAVTGYFTSQPVSAQSGTEGFYISQPTEQPDIPQVAAGNRSLTVTIPEPQGTEKAGLPNYDGFDLQHRTATETQWTDYQESIAVSRNGGATVTLSDLTNGTEYHVRYRVTRDQDGGPWSEHAAGTPQPSLPGPPRNLSVEQVPYSRTAGETYGSTGLNIKWQPPSDDGGGARPLTYRVSFQKGGTGERIAATLSDHGSPATETGTRHTLSIADADAEYGTWYRITVVAINEQGDGENASIDHRLAENALAPNEPSAVVSGPPQNCANLVRIPQAMRRAGAGTAGEKLTYRFQTGPEPGGGIRCSPQGQRPASNRLPGGSLKLHFSRSLTSPASGEASVSVTGINLSLERSDTPPAENVFDYTAKIARSSLAEIEVEKVADGTVATIPGCMSWELAYTGKSAENAVTQRDFCETAGHWQITLQVTTNLQGTAQADRAGSPTRLTVTWRNVLYYEYARQAYTEVEEPETESNEVFTGYSYNPWETSSQTVAALAAGHASATTIDFSAFYIPDYLDEGKTEDDLKCATLYNEAPQDIATGLLVSKEGRATAAMDLKSPRLSRTGRYLICARDQSGITTDDPDTLVIKLGLSTERESGQEVGIGAWVNLRVWGNNAEDQPWPIAGFTVAGRQVPSDEWETMGPNRYRVKMPGSLSGVDADIVVRTSGGETASVKVKIAKATITTQTPEHRSANQQDGIGLGDIFTGTVTGIGSAEVCNPKAGPIPIVLLSENYRPTDCTETAGTEALIRFQMHPTDADIRQHNVNRLLNLYRADSQEETLDLSIKTSTGVTLEGEIEMLKPEVRLRDQEVSARAGETYTLVGTGFPGGNHLSPPPKLRIDLDLTPDAPLAAKRYQQLHAGTSVYHWEFDHKMNRVPEAGLDGTASIRYRILIDEVDFSSNIVELNIKLAQPRLVVYGEQPSSHEGTCPPGSEDETGETGESKSFTVTQGQKIYFGMEGLIPHRDGYAISLKTGSDNSRRGPDIALTNRPGGARTDNKGCIRVSGIMPGWETGENGVVTIQVYDANGEPVPGTQVVLTYRETVETSSTPLPPPPANPTPRGPLPTPTELPRFVPTPTPFNTPTPIPTLPSALQPTQSIESPLIPVPGSIGQGPGNNGVPSEGTPAHMPTRRPLGNNVAIELQPTVNLTPTGPTPLPTMEPDLVVAPVDTGINRGLVITGIILGIGLIAYIIWILVRRNRNKSLRDVFPETDTSIRDWGQEEPQQEEILRRPDEGQSPEKPNTPTTAENTPSESKPPPPTAS